MKEFGSLYSHFISLAKFQFCLCGVPGVRMSQLQFVLMKRYCKHVSVTVVVSVGEHEEKYKVDA
jgi:hypothetical protein